MSNENPESQRVLVVDSEPEHRGWLADTAAAAGGEVTAAGAEVDLEKDVDPRAYELIIINADELERQQRLRILRMLRRWSTQERTARPLLVSDVRKGYSEVFRELRSYGLMNLAAKNEGDSNREDLSVTIRKILTNQLFGIAQYFGEDAASEKMVVRSSAEVPKLFEAARDFASEIKLHPRLVDGFGTAVEELVMNALFNAPVDDDGNPRYAHVERSATIEVEEGEEVTLELMRSSQRVGLAVADNFGELSVERCLQRLGKCYRMGDEQVEFKDGGAGLGLYFSFGALSQLIVNVAPRKRTEVIGLIEAGGAYRDFAKRAKSFNCFVEV